jgi:Arc/MetJ-type ribon-helix-helix transcriptional regulator
MLYVNVPLPKPLVDKIDEIIADESNSFRSRPDFILQHIRDVVDKELAKRKLLPE